MENNDIQLDGAPFEKAMQPVLNSLREFRNLIVALDQSPTGRLTAEMQQLKTGVVGFAGELERSLNKLPALMAKQVKEASQSVNRQMRQSGTDAGENFNAGMNETMRAQLQARQRWYEQMVSLNAKFKPGVLDNLKAQGVNLGPELKGQRFDEGLSAKALEADLAGYRAMLALKKASELNLASEKEALTKKGLEADLAGYRAMLALKQASELSLASEKEALTKKGLGSDLASYRAMLALKLQADKDADAARLALLGRTSQVKLNNSEFNNLGPSSVAKGVNIGRVTDVAADTEAMKANKAANLDAAAAKAKVRGASEATSGELKLHAGVARELHSAYRGLASGFGAMWLTWGSVLPLLAGAAVSHAASQAIRMGAEVGQSLAVIQNLGGATAEEMVGLNRALLEVSRNGPFGPKEVAKALETLALAGLSAREQMEALKPTLDFSIAGQMSIEKGASALVAISTAFGYQAQDMRVVSDIITKTAAISMASAESMAASFKVASVVAQQYNVSLEDVATTLALLAQIGIKDQAAGTAVRQMYSELIGTSAKARKVMQETLKFDAFDELGKNLKPLPQMFAELSAAFVRLDFKSQNRALLDMGNERATKAIAANLRAVQGEVQKSAKEFEAMGMTTEQAMTRSKEAVATNMDKIRAQLEDAPGFSALAAIGLGNSTQNQMKSALAGLQTSLVEAFQAVEPVVARVATQLQMLFKSEEFRTGLTALVSGVADLTGWLARNFDLIAIGAIGYYATTMAMTAYASITTLAAAAAAGAAVSFGALALTLLPLTLLITAVGGAYWFFTKKVDETAAARENEQASAYRTIESVKAESERLRILIEAKGDEAAAREESARVLEQATLAAIVGAGAEKVKVLELSSGYLQLAKAKEQSLGGWDAMGNYTSQDDGSAARLQDLDAQIAKIHEMTGAQVFSAKAEFDLLRARAKEAKTVADARRAARPLQGDGKYDGDKPKSSNGAAQDAKSAYDVLKQQLDNELKALDDKAKREDDIAKLREARIKSSYNLGITNFTEYQASLDEAQKQHLDSRLADAIAGQKAADRFLEESTKRAADANARQAEGKKTPVSVEKLAADQESARLKAAVEGRKVEQLRNQQAVEGLLTMEQAASQMVKASRAALDKLDNSKLELSFLKEQTAERSAQFLLGGREAEVEAARLQSRDSFRKAERDLVREIAQYETQIANLKSLSGTDEYVSPSDALRDPARRQQLALAAARDNLGSLRAQGPIDGDARAKEAGGLSDAKAMAKLLDGQKVKDYGNALRGMLGDANEDVVNLAVSMDSLGQSMKGAFGTAGDALSKLMDVMQKYGAQQEQIDAATRSAMEIDTSTTAGLEKQEKALAKIRSEDAKGRLGAYADMASAAKGFFREGTTGYKTMDGVAKAAHMAQVAMNLIEMGQLAVKAVLNQAGGDPYSAFFRMAAMAAAVGALGFAVGGGFDKAADPNNSSASRQARQGAGTVLGDMGTVDENGLQVGGAKSNSLLASLEAMEKNTFTQLKYSSGMLDALKSIQRSMAGLAQIIFRTNGLTSGNAFDVKEGSIKINQNPLLDAIGAPTLESLFGFTNGKIKTSISDSGIGINGRLGELTQGRGFSQYADTQTETSSFFGLKKKTTNSTQTRALQQDTADQLASVFAGISSSLQIATTGFGRDADTIAAQLAASVISIPAISLRGLKGQELQDALNAVFSGAADNLARTVAPGFEALQKAGEGYFETVLRASTALATANGQLERLRLRLFAVSTAGAVAATKLTDLFGGINEFNAAVGSFYGNYSTDAERAARSTEEMAKALSTVNLALPESKDALKALVSTLDLDTEPGRKAFAVLMDVQQEFSDTADLIGKAAQDTAGKLLKAFTADGIDFAGLRGALASQTTDVLVSVIGQAFDQLAGRIKSTIDGIANERNAVRDAMLQINRPGAMSKDEILRGIADEKRNITGENAGAEARLAALAGARTGLSDADAVLAARRNDLAVMKSWVPDNSGVEKATARLTAELEAARTAGTPGYGDAVLSAAMARQQALNAVNQTRANQTVRVADAQTGIDRATAAQTAAVGRANLAQLAYAAALQTFSVDASKSLTRLGKLREETVRYHDAQKQLADLMSNSAKGLRDTVRLTRIGQLDGAQSLTQKQADFAKNYSLALSTTGAAQAGYADKLAGALPDLNTALMDVARTREEWAIAASGALAQSEKIAALLEANAPKDYAAESLSMLGQIDATLTALDQSSKSAEKIISDAVNAGSDKTANGLRAVIAALTGQAIPAFAAGGTFAGGLRIVGENGPELEATGPSRIYNAAQTRSLLSGGSGNTARLEALVEKLTQEVEGLRFEARATATHTSGALTILKRVTPDGDAMATRVAA